MKKKAENDAADRKRMKERLKEALHNKSKTKFKSEVGETGFLEYVFGICKPDGRVSKHGSRLFKFSTFKRSFRRVLGAEI